MAGMRRYGRLAGIILSVGRCREAAFDSGTRLAGTTPPIRDIGGVVYGRHSAPIARVRGGTGVPACWSRQAEGHGPQSAIARLDLAASACRPSCDFHSRYRPQQSFLLNSGFPQHETARETPRPIPGARHMSPRSVPHPASSTSRSTRRSNPRWKAMPTPLKLSSKAENPFGRRPPRSSDAGGAGRHHSVPSTSITPPAGAIAEGAGIGRRSHHLRCRVRRDHPTAVPGLCGRGARGDEHGARPFAM